MSTISDTIHTYFNQAKVVATFNDQNHIDFILIRTSQKEYFLLWLPSTLTSGMKFRVRMNPNRFIHEFQAVKVQERITYVLKNFINTDFQDLEIDLSQTLQKQINYGIHN